MSGPTSIIANAADAVRSRLVPTPDELRQLLRYEPETGKLFWRERGPEWFQKTEKRTADHACANWNSRYAGKETFVRTDSEGRKRAEIFARPHKAHRVIWAMVHGEWPTHTVDHEDLDPGNNRLNNLRAATESQNQHNRTKTRANTSGFKGVFRDKRRGAWFAAITVNSRSIYLGAYATPEDASRAYADAAAKYHGKFARVA